GDAEALSGLARAFFYAKARAARVALVCEFRRGREAHDAGFAELSADPQIGRAEALRRSMASSLPRARRTRHILPLGHRSCWWAKEPDSTCSHGSQSWSSVAIGQVSEGVLMCLRRSGHA